MKTNSGRSSTNKISQKTTKSDNVLFLGGPISGSRIPTDDCVAYVTMEVIKDGKPAQNYMYTRRVFVGFGDLSVFAEHTMNLEEAMHLLVKGFSAQKASR